METLDRRRLRIAVHEAWRVRNPARFTSATRHREYIGKVKHIDLKVDDVQRKATRANR
jgi:hypothetical protein